MALSKTVTAPLAAAGNTAGSTTNSSNITIGYGVDIIAQVSTGATGPTIGCSVNLQVTTDGGTTWITQQTRTAGVANTTTYPFEFSLGVAGASGDWATARVNFAGNTAQAVTCQVDASSTTSL